MERLEIAVQVMRIVNKFNYGQYTREEIKNGIEMLDQKYTEVESEDGYHLYFDFDPEISMHFTYANNQYQITKFNIMHGVLNEIQKYYNELDVSKFINQTELAICKQDIEMLETVGFKAWQDKEIIVKRILKLFHSDEIVATLMFLKHIGSSANKSISYIERHSMPITHGGKTTNMCIELFNTNYYRMITIDIVNCEIIDDKYELIVNAFKRWAK